MGRTRYARAAAVALTLALALVLAACGGKTITSERLASIMPSAADAPTGTDVQASSVGPKILTEFVEDMSVRAKLRSLGFRSAYTASFATPGFPADPSTAPLGASLYATFGVVLRDAAAASNGFAFYAKRSRDRAGHLTVILTKDLGPDSFAFHFSNLDNTPLPGVGYLWRVDNALFSVVGVGNPSPDPTIVRSLVATIERRATD